MSRKINNLEFKRLDKQGFGPVQKVEEEQEKEEGAEEEGEEEEKDLVQTLRLSVT